MELYPLKSNQDADVRPLGRPPGRLLLTKILSDICFFPSSQCLTRWNLATSIKENAASNCGLKFQMSRLVSNSSEERVRPLNLRYSSKYPDKLRRGEKIWLIFHINTQRLHLAYLLATFFFPQPG